MIPIETLAIFFLASVALSLAPGPDNLFVLAQSAIYGPVAGWVITLGLCTGLVAHMLAVAFGVAALLAASPLAFSVLKLLGATYLIYLAWAAFRASAAVIEHEAIPKPSWPELYFRGVVMNISNPKVAVFFLAFLPQFADPSLSPVAQQVIIFGLVFILAALSVFGAIAWASGLLANHFRRSSFAQVTLNRVAGVVFVGLAIRLLVAEV